MAETELAAEDSSSGTGKKSGEKSPASTVAKSSPLGRRSRGARRGLNKAALDRPADAPVSATKSSKARAQKRAPVRAFQWWKAAVALALIALIAASVFFAIASARINHDRALRDEYAAFADRTVTKLLTLDPSNADAMYDFAVNESSGRAQQMFRDNMKNVADLVRNSDAKTEMRVLANAVEEASDQEGTALMVVGWSDKTVNPSEPVLLTYRWKVEMTRINGALKVTDLEFIQ